MGNKAPLSLSFEASWLVINKGFLDVLDEWMDHILLTYQDAYFVTELQVLQWIQNPTNNQGLRDFQDWKDKCTVKGQPFCHLPNACPLTTRELPVRLFDYTRVKNVQETTLGFLILLVMD